MLPIPTLDDERFHEIVENARNRIPTLDPDWTDFNEHDPGITFLELFAFLKESQQYHLDQIGPAQRGKYLKLLGLHRQRRTPAQVQAAVTGPLAGTLPAGTRLLAGEIPFETQRPLRFGGGRLRGGFTEAGGRRTEFEAGVDAETGKLQLEVFGREARPGAAWYLRFDGPLPDPVHLWLWVRQDWAVRRNPVEDEPFTPLADIAWEYLGSAGWKPLEVLADETRGLLFSGGVTLGGGGDCCRAQPEGDGDLPEGFYLRARLAGGAFDVPPVLTGLSDALVGAVQRDTLCACRICGGAGGVFRLGGVLAAVGEYEAYLPAEDDTWRRAETAERETDRESGETVFTVAGGADRAMILLWREDFGTKRSLGCGTGFPGQTAELDRTGQICEDFQLLVAEPDRPGNWRLWEKAEDYDTSGPADCRYVLDEEAGVIRFGDGLRGLAPEGEILIAGEADTLGRDGNVKAGRVEAAELEEPGLWGLEGGELSVRNPDNAAGGSSRESDEACFLRCRRLLRQTDRAVTDRDYEELVRRTPGLMISNCKAVPANRLPRQDGSPRENWVAVVVEPFSLGQTRTLSSAYEANILRCLDQRRMLGTKVTLLSPEYIDIAVYAEILSQPQYVDARERIRAAVAEYFRPGWEFGAPVLYSELYGIIDTLQCVAGIDTLTIDAQGKGISRSLGGDVVLPYNGLAVLRSADIQVRPAE
jgi:hypothetical protein